MRTLLLTTLALMPAAVLAQDTQATDDGQAPMAVGVATMMDADGNEIGEVRLSTMESGFVNVVINVEGIPTGVHGVHVHEVGDCSASDFTSAGPHISGDNSHGFDSANGPHPGDLANAHVQDDGVLAAQYMTVRLIMDDTMIFDDDGSAVIVHANSDDYQTDPGGNAGDRIACGEIVNSEQ